MTYECPACGLTNDGEAGDCTICDRCGWEDCGNPDGTGDGPCLDVWRANWPALAEWWADRRAARGEHWLNHPTPSEWLEGKR